MPRLTHLVARVALFLTAVGVLALFPSRGRRLRTARLRAG